MAVSIHMKYGCHRYLEQPADCLTIDLNKEMPLGQLLEGQGIPIRAVYMVLINEKLATLDSVVRDNDTISLYPPIEGG